MTSNTLPKVAEKAPAAAPRRNAKGEKLLDTHAFLRHVRSAHKMTEMGVAIQGRRHDDAKKAKARDGRHLVAATRKEDNLSFFLLNSHFKDRRAHIGVGVQRGGAFLIGPTLAVQRWRGYEEPVEQLAARLVDVGLVVQAFEQYHLPERDISRLASLMSRKGYMTTVEARPAPKALIDGLSSDLALDVGFYIIGRMLAGNLEAKGEGRRIKRVRRPDGLFHAGMVMFDGLLTYMHAHDILPEVVNFGPLKERLIRP